MASNKSKFPEELWDGSSPSRPDPTVHRASQPEDYDQVVEEVRAAQDYVKRHISDLEKNAQDDTKDSRNNARRRRQASRAVKKGLRFRILGGGASPTVVPNGTSAKQQIGLSAGENCCISAVVVEYLTLPTTAGTLVYELYVRRDGADVLLASLDLLSLVADTAKKFTINGSIKPLSRMWGQIVSDNADATNGTEGLLTLHGQIEA